ncbi:AarF/ABC1/UbiB kinase family protein [Thalassobacillus sp. CUG 92003]|uniref:ABC1 kinase family protein n=1 Tax=Thalassobacillus sp. CUG 92003 TaxID=2736641 RepID=UPI0015E6F415|nr:AarF/UbiB family protein [Thalassobacillus sp. CUG 92003]
MNKKRKYVPLFRVTLIVWMAVKFLLQITWFQKTHRIWDEETEREWEDLLAKQATEYRKKAIELGGLLIKFGQFLSSRGDLLPDSFIKELEGLVDRVKPVPFEYSRLILEEDWNDSIENVLQNINEEPVASASIGEVYQAWLKDGTPVALKVRRHRVKEIFHMDFKALRIVFWLLSRFTSYGKKADLKALYRELVTVISNELDFTKELKNGRHFKRRFKDFSSVYIPEYYQALSTQRVIVMEWIEGTKITDLSYMKHHQIDRQHVAKILFDLCVEQFLYTGMFHSDPHPGNLMIQEDGTVVVIDFGMVGEVKKRDAGYIRSMIQGFILDDYDKVIEALRSMNFLLDNANTEQVKKILKETADMYLEGGFDKLDAHTMNHIIEDIQTVVKEQPIQLPADYAFLGRATSIIVGVVTTIYPQVDLIQWGRPVIKDWMAGDDSSYSVYKEIAKETGRPLLSLPRALINFLEDGDQERDWEKQKQQNRFFHQYYMLYSCLAYMVILVGGSCGVAGVIYAVPVIIWTGFSFAGLGILGVLLAAIKHMGMIKHIK